MTRFAFGAKCGRPGRPPVAEASAKSSEFRSEPSATTPIPVAPRRKKCRRVTASASALACAAVSCSIASIYLFPGNRFIEVEDHSRNHRVSRKLRLRNLRRKRGFADRRQFIRPAGIALVVEFLG